MVLRNASGLSTVYRKVCLCVSPTPPPHTHTHTQAEELFQRLRQAQEMFRGWVVLGCVDIPALVEAHCSTVADWEHNIRALKAKGREAERLPKYVQ